MDFEFSEEQRLIRDSVKKFAETELLPHANRVEAEGLPPDIFPRLAQMGLLGLNIAPDYGGVGLDVLTAVIAVEELVRGSSAIALSYGAHDNLCSYNLYRNGSESQRRKYLPSLCRGEKVGALAITEPDAGSDAVGITTRAEKRGDKYVINGVKRFITNAPIADVVLVYAKTAPELMARGISAFIVERTFPGFAASAPIDKIGNRGSPTSDIVLDNCEVPQENLLGRENDGIHVMMSGLDIERTFFAGMAVGQAQLAMEYAIRYARDRKQFGKPIGTFQLIQAKLADMYTQIEAARLLCYKTAVAAEKSMRGGKGSEIHLLSAASLLMAAEVSQKVCCDSLQIHGGYGYTTEYDISRLYRDVRLNTIGAGTSEMRRLIIGRELLGL